MGPKCGRHSLEQTWTEQLSWECCLKAVSDWSKSRVMLKTRWMMERRREQGRWIERREKWLGRKERRERWRGEDEWRWCCRNQPRSGGKICTNPVCRHIFLEREQSFISFFLSFFLPPHTGGQFHLLEYWVLWLKTQFLKGHLHLGNISVFFFMTIPSQKEKPLLHTSKAAPVGERLCECQKTGYKKKKKKETNPFVKHKD